MMAEANQLKAKHRHIVFMLSETEIIKRNNSIKSTVDLGNCQAFDFSNNFKYRNILFKISASNKPLAEFNWKIHINKYLTSHTSPTDK